MIVATEGATQGQEATAEEIIGVLAVAYPNHPWMVKVYDGGFFIRHLDFPAKWGMNFKAKNIYSASQMKKQIILMAGEWLERANLARGMWDETPHGFVDGIPLKDQPPEVKPPVRAVEGEKSESV